MPEAVKLPWEMTLEEFRIQENARRTEKRTAALRDVEYAATQLGGIQHLVDWGVMRAGETLEAFAMRYAWQGSEWKKGRQTQRTGLQVLSERNLFGATEGGENLRKVLLAFLRGEKACWYGPNDKPAPAAHRDFVSFALENGRTVPEAVLAEYPDLRLAVR